MSAAIGTKNNIGTRVERREKGSDRLPPQLYLKSFARMFANCVSSDVAFAEQKPLAVVDPFAQLKSKLGQVRWADESDDDEPAPSVENRGFSVRHQ